MNSWQELTVEVLRDAEEAASNILIELGSQGVAIDDSADYLGHVGKYGEVFPKIKQVETVKITAYYPETVDIEAVENRVELFCGYLLFRAAQQGLISLESLAVWCMLVLGDLHLFAAFQLFDDILSVRVQDSFVGVDKDVAESAF